MMVVLPLRGSLVQCLEQLFFPGIVYTLASVNYMHFKHLGLVIVGCLYRNLPIICRFKGVLGQVNQHLLQANFISLKLYRQIFLLYSLLVIYPLVGGLRIRQVLQADKLERAVHHFDLR